MVVTVYELVPDVRPVCDPDILDALVTGAVTGTAEYDEVAVDPQVLAAVTLILYVAVVFDTLTAEAGLVDVMLAPTPDCTAHVYVTPDVGVAVIVYALVALGQTGDGADMPGVDTVEVAVVVVLLVYELVPQALFTVQDTVYAPADDGAVTVTVDPVVELAKLPPLSDQL